MEVKVSFGMETDQDLSMAVDPSTVYQVRLILVHSKFSFATPLNADPDTTFELTMANASNNRTFMSSYHERVNGLTAKFKVLTKI
jgi:hypothetical protein